MHPNSCCVVLPQASWVQCEVPWLRGSGAICENIPAMANAYPRSASLNLRPRRDVSVWVVRRNQSRRHLQVQGESFTNFAVRTTPRHDDCHLLRFRPESIISGCFFSETANVSGIKRIPTPRKKQAVSLRERARITFRISSASESFGSDCRKTELSSSEPRHELTYQLTKNAEHRLRVAMNVERIRHAIPPTHEFFEIPVLR